MKDFTGVMLKYTDNASDVLSEYSVFLFKVVK